MKYSRLPGFLFLLIIAISAQAESPTGEIILDGLNVSDSERKRLESGDVLAFDGEAYESNARELSADATVLVDRPMSDVLAQIMEAPTIIPQKYIVEHRDITSVEDFADIRYDEDEYDEANKLLKAKASKDLNLSKAEIAKLKQINATVKTRPDRLEAASKAMREILTERYLAYSKTGLTGMPTYQRSSRKALSIGNELTLTTETLEPFSKYFPEYYRVLHDFPEGADCCDHIFRWLKFDIRKRPTFALSHTMIEKGEDFLLITERHYYVSSTLNSVQVTLSWVPYDENTQMGLAISASTDILDSFMGKLLRPLGRNKARDMVSDVLTEIRNDLLEEEN
jgi:hypothetical protein